MMENEVEVQIVQDMTLSPSEVRVSGGRMRMRALSTRKIGRNEHV